MGKSGKDARGDDGLEMLIVARGDEIDEPVFCSHDVARPLEDPAEHITPIESIHQAERCLVEGLKKLIPVGERLAHGPFVGDVTHDDHPVQKAAVRSVDRNNTLVGPKLGAIAPLVAHLDADGNTRIHGMPHALELGG